MSEVEPPRRRRALVLSLVAAVCLLVGGAMVAAAVVGQDDPVEPPLTASRDAARPSPSPTTSAVTPTTAPTTKAVTAPVADPVAISIPAIEVRSDLIHLGLRPDGTLDVPSGPDYDKAAWYDGSPAPGAVGPAVIEGHIDSAKGGPSVFFRLGELTPGDEVVVDRADGSAVTFVVDRIERYPKDDFPTLAVYGNTDDAELRLITCGGDFDAEVGHYRDNTVVYGHAVTG